MIDMSRAAATKMPPREQTGLRRGIWIGVQIITSLRAKQSTFVSAGSVHMSASRRCLKSTLDSDLSPFSKKQCEQRCRCSEEVKNGL